MKWNNEAEAREQIKEIVFHTLPEFLMKRRCRR